MAVTLGVAGGPEVRQAGDYTDQLTAAYFGAATGERVRAAASAGVQVAAGALGRALASADVEGDRGVLDPMLLEGVGTDLVRAGRFLGLLRVDPRTGKPMLLRAGAVASVVYGSADPSTWRYSLHMGGPSAAETVRAAAAETVNVRLNADSYRPWEGIDPLTRAAASGTLYGRLAASLGNEAAVAVLRLIPMPGGSTVDTGTLRAKLASGNIAGRLAFPTTTASGFGAGRSSAPLTDWKALRVGFDGTEAAVKLYALLMTEAAECCGGAGAAGQPGQRRTRGQGGVAPLHGGHRRADRADARGRAVARARGARQAAAAADGRYRRGRPRPGRCTF